MSSTLAAAHVRAAPLARPAMWRVATPMSLSGAIGLLVWSQPVDPPGGMFWLALLPLMWLLAPTRFAGFAAVLSYHLAAGPTTAAAAAGYFPQWSALACVAVYLAFALALSLPWALLDVRREVAPGRRLLALAAVVLISVAPPVGVISAWHPLLAAAWVYPGGGWLALAIVLAAWGAVAWRPRITTGVLSTAAMGAIALATSWGYTEPSAPPRLLALDQAVARAPTFAAFGMKLEQLNTQLRELARPPGSVVVLPETAIEEWKPSVQAMVSVALRQRLLDGPLLAGTMVRDASGSWGAAVLIQHDGPATIVRSRQPLVLGLWHPWDPVDHYSANWLHPEVMEVAGERASIRLCSEEFPLFWTLVDQIVDRPTVMIVMGSHYWSNTIMHDVTQSRHGRAAARLFGIPIVRAINRSPSHPAARALAPAPVRPLRRLRPQAPQAASATAALAASAPSPITSSASRTNGAGRPSEVTQLM